LRITAADFEFNYKPRDMAFVWLTAGGVRNPASYLSTSPDLLATLMSHSTNLAFRDNVLFTTNLGRWHITVIETAAESLPLYGGNGALR
jgi:hypothetical protein